VNVAASPRQVDVREILGVVASLPLQGKGTSVCLEQGPSLSMGEPSPLLDRI
jgi:hypothetical protein